MKSLQDTLTALDRKIANMETESKNTLLFTGEINSYNQGIIKGLKMSREMVDFCLKEKPSVKGVKETHAALKRKKEQLEGNSKDTLKCSGAINYFERGQIQGMQMSLDMLDICLQQEHAL